MPDQLTTKPTPKYVIFFCDECELLSGTIALFQRMHPLVGVITFSDRANLILHLSNETPELILVYLTLADREYISFVKDIRENISSTLVPVLIYHALPNEEEIRLLLME